MNIEVPKFDVKFLKTTEPTCLDCVRDNLVACPASVSPPGCVLRHGWAAGRSPLPGTCAHPEGIQLTIFLGFRSDMLRYRTRSHRRLSKCHRRKIMRASGLKRKLLSRKRHTGIRLQQDVSRKYGTGMLDHWSILQILFLRKFVKTTALCRVDFWNKKAGTAPSKIMPNPDQTSPQIQTDQDCPADSRKRYRYTTNPHSTSHFSWQVLLELVHIGIFCKDILAKYDFKRNRASVDPESIRQFWNPTFFWADWRTRASPPGWPRASG